MKIKKLIENLERLMIKYGDREVSTCNDNGCYQKVDMVSDFLEGGKIILGLKMDEDDYDEEE